MKTPSKIYIVGIAGSGKTTLARRLKRELGYPNLDLDRVRYPDFKTTPDDATLKPSISHLLEQPKWVAEGAYTTWSAPLLEAADSIIWLDTDPAIATYRILKRHIIKLLHGQKHFSNRSTITLAWAALNSRRTGPFLRKTGARQTAIPWHQEIEEGLAPYNEKVLHFDSLNAADKVVFEK
ncbi:MAG TPA: hypothetical protein VF272_01445 [Candidatus Saccharimonadia bacterium]